MRQIPVSSSLLTFLDEMEFTEAALRADEHAAEFAAGFDEEIAGWNEVFQRERAARREVIRGDALVAVRNGQVDDVTLRFGALALVEANRDRKSPLFRKFFPTAPSEFVRGALRKQCERTRDVIVPEINKLPEGSMLKPFGDLLSKGAKAALAALTARSKAQGEAASVASDVLEWKEGINRLRTTTHAELIKVATEQRLGRAWVEMFFRSASDAGAADEGYGATPTEPTAEPTTKG